MKGKVKPDRLIKNLLVGAIAGVLIGAVISGVLIVKQNKEIAGRKEQLVAALDGEEDMDAWVSAQMKRFDTYPLTAEEEERYEALAAKGTLLPEDDYGNQLAFIQAAKALEEAVKTRLEEEAQARLASLESLSPGYATDEEKMHLSAYADQMKSLIAEGRYKDLDALEAQWIAFAEKASQKKTGYTVDITQYDLSRYPTVRLYLDVRDQASNSLIENLAPNMFYVSERAAQDGEFLNRAVQKAVWMNENERLNLNLIVDTSGSMSDYGKMDSAKRIIKNFLGTVQFPAGDQVKLTQFNSYIDKSGSFTNNLGQLDAIVDSYQPSGQTKLYDTLIYGVQDASGQEGAKCVIAFTDGMDVGSANSAEDVVQLVSRYQIPVFIVRIGDNSDSGADQSLRRIAEASGGSFQNLSQFSSDMASLYNQIYRQMKQYYVVEFEAASEDAQAIVNDQAIDVYVQNQDKGGETVLNINPGHELFDSLLGSYLRSYIEDMNNHNYDKLRQYVDDTTAPDDKWSIKWQMQKQVTGGFSNVTSESLMDYSVTDITVQDANTVRLKTNENYDVIYDEVYGDLKKSERTVARDALAYLQQHYGYSDLDDGAQIRIWAKVNQVPEYIIKRGADGQWKFSSYAGNLALGERRQVYDVEVTYDPSYYGW